MPSDILKGKKLSIGFDPNLFTEKSLFIFFGKNKYKLKPIFHNLIDEIWKRKIVKNDNKFYLLPNEAVSEKYQLKINKISKYLMNKRSDFLFVTASENNAWLLNIRGRDTNYTPIPHSYILIDKNKNIKFFCDLKKVSSPLRRGFKSINFLDIKDCANTLLEIEKKKFIIDDSSCSIFFKNIIDKNNKILNLRDPVYFFKAIKGKQEIENIKKAHIYDGVALTKYLLWLKKNFYKKNVTEITASQKLLKFRKKNKKFKFLSFPTISGTGPNGAIIHYKATRDTDRKLRKGDIYLVDSGGQYEFGTTDVTRTISLKNSNKRIKDIFTRVLKGHIAVSNFKLKKNTSGSEIDTKARKYLKQIGLNYAHGTGHGVGYFLNVHEGPHAISKRNKINFQKGMIVSNEPGYYEKNKFGIRIENLIYVKENKKQLAFENLTMAPIEKDLIIQEMLNKNEKDWLNNYHKTVFKNLRKSMNKNETLELKKACSAI
jgi:Xaa-Pro aminopeptidase